MGLEPATYGLQNRCSTIELHRHLSIYYCGHEKLSSINFLGSSCNKKAKVTYFFRHVAKNVVFDVILI